VSSACSWGQVCKGGGTYLRLGMLTYEGSWGQGGPGAPPAGVWGRAPVIRRSGGSPPGKFLKCETCIGEF
jgi:hypothetical protein